MSKRQTTEYVLLYVYTSHTLYYVKLNIIHHWWYRFEERKKHIIKFVCGCVALLCLRVEKVDKNCVRQNVIPNFQFTWSMYFILMGNPTSQLFH